MKFYESTEDCLQTYLSNREKCWPKKRMSENGGEDPEDIMELMFNQRHSAVIENGIGYVHIYGMLLKDATMYDRMLGNTDYEDIIDDIDMLTTAGVKAIVFVVNSGGGTTLGSIECAKYIKNCQVPTIAYVDGCACSAAYKLISGCTYIVASESASVGNIGTIMAYVDISKMYAASGINYLTFVNDGAIYKSIGHGDTALTDEQKNFLQESVNKLGSEFKDFVLTNRALSDEVYTAAWYSGQDSVNVGLVDSVGTFSDAIEVAMSVAEI